VSPASRRVPPSIRPFAFPCVPTTLYHRTHCLPIHSPSSGESRPVVTPRCAPDRERLTRMNESISNALGGGAVESGTTDRHTETNACG
jgi:hypothetical protein